MSDLGAFRAGFGDTEDDLLASIEGITELMAKGANLPGGWRRRVRRTRVKLSKAWFWFRVRLYLDRRWNAVPCCECRRRPNDEWPDRGLDHNSHGHSEIYGEYEQGKWERRHDVSTA